MPNFVVWTCPCGTKLKAAFDMTMEDSIVQCPSPS
jgi:hypothetical protein